MHREQKSRVGILSKFSSTKKLGHKQIFIQEALFSHIIEAGETNTFEVAQTARWMAPNTLSIVRYTPIK